MIRVLRKDPDKRTTAELHSIIPFFKQIDFFREKEIKESYYLDIVTALRHESFSHGDIVFEDGTFLLNEYYRRLWR